MVELIAVKEYYLYVERAAKIRLHWYFLLLVFIGIFVFLYTPKTQAAISPYINFQGKITNPDGTNITNGNYTIVFSAYTVASGGAAVWSESKSVTVSDGMFQTLLGDTTALPGSIDFNGSLYLGIKVGADAEMTPRVTFTSSPYSFNSSLLDGLDSTNIVQLAQGLQTDSSTTNTSIAINKTGITAKIMDLQRGGTSVFSVNNDGSTNIKTQTNSATAFQVQSSGSVAILTADTTNNELLVGSATTDTTQVLFQLDSFDTTADTATCATTTNQGGIYYNTKTNSVRACINGAWEDLVSTAGLGLQLFGVVPDSGTANQGDLASVTGGQNGPCKVSVGANTTTVSWTACTAYSNGRKVIVAAGTAATTNATAGRFQHLCLTSADNQPVLSASGLETANLATVSLPSVTAPILCLADVRFNAANNTITQIYDTRTFTTTEKIAVTLNSAIGIGTVVVYTNTRGVVVSTNTANTNNIAGVVVAGTGGALTNAVNAILAHGGPANVKAVTGTNAVNAYLFTSTTAGYASTVATKPAEGTATIYNVLGNARTPWSGATACAINSDACQGSILTYIDKR